MEEIEKKIREMFFDYHIRGCGLADDKTNIICTNRKEQDIKELLALFSQSRQELIELLQIRKLR